MFCSNCGTENLEGSTKCKNCGYDFLERERKIQKVDTLNNNKKEDSSNERIGIYLVVYAFAFIIGIFFQPFLLIAIFSILAALIKYPKNLVVRIVFVFTIIAFILYIIGLYVLYRMIVPYISKFFEWILTLP